MSEIIYKAEDIFKEIDGDEDNVLMNIPPEVIQAMGWEMGDTLSVEVTESGTIKITKVNNGEKQ